MKMRQVSVMIVDDELTSRNTIKTILEKTERYRVAADFADGREALRWIKENRADMILCDMSMPHMNGVEFIRLLRLSYPDMPVLAVSGYNDFNYLRDCMQTDVTDYLLKHELTKETLVAALERAEQKYHVVTSGEEDTGIHGHWVERAEDFTAEKIRMLLVEKAVPLGLGDYVFLVIEPDVNAAVETDYAVYKRNILRATVDIVEQVLGERFPYLLHQNARDQIAVLISFQETASHLMIMNIVTTLCSRCNERAGRLMNVTLTMGVGRICSKLSDAFVQYEKGSQLLGEKLYWGGNKTFSITSTAVIPYEHYMLPPKMEQRMSMCIQEENIVAAQVILDEMFSEIKRIHARREDVVGACQAIASVLQPSLPEDGECGLLVNRLVQFESIAQFEATLSKLCLEAIRFLQQRTKEQLSPAISQAVAFLNENYARDVSLEECAKQVRMSYTHLSRMFSRETGKRFSEYLNHIRVSRAKVLLHEGRYKMKEVAAMTGFRNYNYFFKVFKEMEGVTPNEYMAGSKKV